MSPTPWQRSLTEYILIGFIVILTGYDLWAVRTPSATISEVTIAYAYRHPVLAWLFGCLMAHLYWPVVSTRPHWQTTIVVVMTISFGIWLDILGWVPAMMPIIPLLVGIPSGHMLWPQKMATATGETLVVQPKDVPVTLEGRTITTTIDPAPKPSLPAPPP